MTKAIINIDKAPTLQNNPLWDLLSKAIIKSVDIPDFSVYDSEINISVSVCTDTFLKVKMIKEPHKIIAEYDNGIITVRVIDLSLDEGSDQEFIYSEKEVLEIIKNVFGIRSSLLVETDLISTEVIFNALSSTNAAFAGSGFKSIVNKVEFKETGIFIADMTASDPENSYMYICFVQWVCVGLIRIDYYLFNELNPLRDNVLYIKRLRMHRDYQLGNLATPTYQEIITNQIKTQEDVMLPVASRDNDHVPRRFKASYIVGGERAAEELEKLAELNTLPLLSEEPEVVQVEMDKSPSSRYNPGPCINDYLSKKYNTVSSEEACSACLKIGLNEYMFMVNDKPILVKASIPDHKYICSYEIYRVDVSRAYEDTKATYPSVIKEKQ